MHLKVCRVSTVGPTITVHTEHLDLNQFASLFCSYNLQYLSVFFFGVTDYLWSYYIGFTATGYSRTYGAMFSVATKVLSKLIILIWKISNIYRTWQF